MLFGIEFSPELHQQLVNVLLLLQVAVDSRGSHTCTLAWLQHRCAFLGCKHNVAERNPVHNAAAAAPATTAVRPLAGPPEIASRTVAPGEAWKNGGAGAGVGLNR